MFLASFQDELTKLAQRAPGDVPVKDSVRSEGTTSVPADEKIYKDRTISRTAEGWKLFHQQQGLPGAKKPPRPLPTPSRSYGRSGRSAGRQGPTEEYSTRPKPAGYEQSYRQRGMKPPKYIQLPVSPRGIGTPKEWAEYHRVKAKMPATPEETNKATYTPPMSKTQLPRLKGSLTGSSPASRLGQKLPQLKKPDVSTAPKPEPLRVQEPRSTFERYQRSSYSTDRQPWESP